MDTCNIKISVVIPVYNTKKYIDPCINSVINQTYKNLEIILVDDGSIDGSGGICDKYAKRDKRIKVIHKINEGLVAAREAGVIEAEGEYIAFVDSDDYIELNTYEYLIEKLEDITVDLVMYNLVEDFEDHSVIKNNKFDYGFYDKNQIQQLIIPHMLSYGYFFDFGILPNLVCKLISKDLWNRAQLAVSHEVKVGEDADVTFQLMIKTNNLQIVDFAPYHYCKHYDSMMWRGINENSIVALERDLKNAFSLSTYRNVLDRQLKEYITFVSLLKCPQIVLGEQLMVGAKRIALYGAGGFGQAVYNEYFREIVVWVDKSYEKYQRLGMPVQGIEELIDRMDEYDVLFIAILNVQLCSTIKNTLIDMGIKKEIKYFEMEYIS